MPVASLGPGGPAVSRVGLGLAALGRPAYITGGREHDLPDRSVTAMRDRTFAVLEAAYSAGVRYVDAARSYGRAEPPRRTGRAGRPGPGADHAGHRQAPDPGSQPCPR
jgi:aryl-alcohol dehydrogenase-like predicted oxidoreductase